MSTRRLLRITVVPACCLLLVLASQAQAIDTMHLVCTGSIPCGPGGIQTTPNVLPTFNVTSTPGNINLSGASPNGTAFLAILVPNQTPDLSFLVNGLAPDAPVPFTGPPNNTAFTVLGENGGNDKTFASQTSFSNTVTASPVLAYDAYDVSLGAFNTSGTAIGVSFTGISGFPVGTIFFAFLEDNLAAANLLGEHPTVNQTPNSESLMVVAPEPGTLSLFGIGLVGVGIWARRRITTARPPSAA